MAQAIAALEIHVEDWFHALTEPCTWDGYLWRLQDTLPWIYNELSHAQVRATFYLLGWIAEKAGNVLRDIVERGHRVGSHGYYHRHGERQGDGSDFKARVAIYRQSVRWGFPMSTHRLPYRAPFWETTPRPGYATGVYVRLLPYPLLRREVARSRVLAVHPHDLDPGHPRFSYVPLRRYIGLKEARGKFHRLLQEVAFERA